MWQQHDLNQSEHSVSIISTNESALLCLEHPDGRTLLCVEGARKGPVPAAALDGVVGRVGDVVVDELAHLHHQDGVVAVRPVVPHGQGVADGPGRGQLHVTRTALTG